MHSLVALPIIEPNWNGAYVSGDPSKGETPKGQPPYPAGTQTHAYVHPGSIVGIVPMWRAADGTPRPGCHVYVAGNPTAIFCMLSADQTVRLLRGD